MPVCSDCEENIPPGAECLEYTAMVRGRIENRMFVCLSCEEKNSGTMIRGFKYKPPRNSLS